MRTTGRPRSGKQSRDGAQRLLSARPRTSQPKRLLDLFVGQLVSRLSRRHVSLSAEMGLHPQAVTAVLLLVLDLLWRGYRVVLSTHSPHVLTMLWMMRLLQTHHARWQLVCDAFDVPRSQQMQRVAESALVKDYRAYSLDFDGRGRVMSVDISGLDPESPDERIAGWGGLTAYSSRFGDVVREAVNEDHS